MSFQSAAENQALAPFMALKYLELAPSLYD